MLFNSLNFILFFPVAVMTYFALPHRFRWAWLLVASYFFYMCWNPAYVVLILTSTCIDYFAALRMGRTAPDRTRRMWLAFSLTGNLGLLFTFKYYNFFANSAQVFTDFYGIPVVFPEANWLLPVGISFYTFQSLSYTIDVFRKERDPEHHFGIFALYVSFFPQLVAGPIERSAHLLPQFFEKHGWDTDRVRSGLLLMGGGFYKKCVIGDALGVYVGEVYANPEQYAGLPFVIAAYAFPVQVFVDFSGYSDIAIGAARIMGFDLCNNFDRPLHSRDLSELWRRWHISLMSWFRDYVYIPLGGSRQSPFRNSVNIFLVFTISGIWHGAAWTYTLWGMVCGLLVVFGEQTRARRTKMGDAVFRNRFRTLRTGLQIFVTYHLFAIPLVIYCSHSMSDCFTVVSKSLAGVPVDYDVVFGPLSAGQLGVVAIAILLMEIVHIMQYRGSVIERVTALPRPIRWCVYAALIYSVLIFGTFGSNDFIYFQF